MVNAWTCIVVPVVVGELGAVLEDAERPAWGCGYDFVSKDYSPGL